MRINRAARERSVSDVRPSAFPPRHRAYAPNIHTSCAVVVAPTFERAFATWCLTVECETQAVRGRLLRPGDEHNYHDPRVDRSSRAVFSRHPRRGGELLIPTLDRQGVGCYPVSNTCRARRHRSGHRGHLSHDIDECRKRISIRASRRACLPGRAAVVATHTRRAANPCRTWPRGRCAGRREHGRRARHARTRDPG